MCLTQQSGIVERRTLAPAKRRRSAADPPVSAQEPVHARAGDGHQRPNRHGSGSPYRKGPVYRFMTTEADGQHTFAACQSGYLLLKTANLCWKATWPSRQTAQRQAAASPLQHRAGPARRYVRYAGSGRIGCHGAVPIASPRQTRIPAFRGPRRISRTVVGLHVAPVTVRTPRRRKSATICRIGTPASRASAAWTISAASAGLTVTPSRPKPKGRGRPALYWPASARSRQAAATPGARCPATPCSPPRT